MAYNSFGLKNLLDYDKIQIILENLGATGLTKDSNGFRSSCPIHKSKGTTVFVYTPEKHLYCCYGECNYEDKDGDIIKLVGLVQKCNYEESIKLICEWTNIDIKSIEDSSDWILEELKNKMDSILLEIYNERYNIINNDWDYGVQPIDELLYIEFKGKTDPLGFINSLGFKEATLTLFESGYDPKEERWLLPIRSPDGKLLGFDGRDVTNKKKDKWKKRKGLYTNKLLGRLDLSKNYILEKDEIVLVEGKKDQMALYEADIKNASCIYGSNLSYFQLYIIDELCSDIVIFPDGDSAGYKMVKSIVNKAYPEYNITVCETPDGEDPANLTTKYVQELYGNRINVEEWLEKYKYRTNKKK